MTITYRISEGGERNSLDGRFVEADDYRYEDATGKLVFVDAAGGTVLEYDFSPTTYVEGILPNGARRHDGIPPHKNPRIVRVHKTFRIEPGFGGTLPEATVVADDYRFHRESGEIVFTLWEDGVVERVPFEKYTRVLDVSGRRPEVWQDDAHANPLSPLHFTFYVGECPREGKTPEDLDRAQEAQARAPGGKKTVIAETFSYHENEIVFRNAWGERVTELPFGPNTWVRREDVDGTILPEYRENPKASPG